MARLGDAAAEPWLPGAPMPHHQCLLPDLPSWLPDPFTGHHQCLVPDPPSWLPGPFTCHHQCFPPDLPSWWPGSHTAHHQCFPPDLPSLHDGAHGEQSHRCTCVCCTYSVLTRYRQESFSPCLCICACCHLLRLMAGPCMRCFSFLQHDQRSILVIKLPAIEYQALV